MFNICQGNIWDVEILKLSTSCNHKQRIINSWFISKSGIIKVLMHEIKKIYANHILALGTTAFQASVLWGWGPTAPQGEIRLDKIWLIEWWKQCDIVLLYIQKYFFKKNICIVAIICIHLPQQTVFSNFVKSIYWLGLWNLVAPVRSARGGVQWSFLFHVISVNSWFKVMYIAILGHTFQIYVANCFCLDAHTYDTMGYVF